MILQGSIVLQIVRPSQFTVHVSDTHSSGKIHEGHLKTVKLYAATDMNTSDSLLNWTELRTKLSNTVSVYGKLLRGTSRN